MTGGEAVAAALAAHGVDTVFGLPGAHNLSLYDALIEAPVRHVLARHEQGAAFMADGYARACGRPGVCVVTSGPAALNTITSLGTAYSDSSPVLCIASQIPAAGIGREKGYLHECSDQLACFRPVTGWCGRADSVAAIPGLLREAFASMSSGRPRPAALEIPCDVLDASGEAEIRGPIQVERLQPGDAAVEEAAAALREAESPVIWAGGGVIASGASAELRQLAETLQAPVFTTVLGKGAFPEDHPLAAGTAILHPQAQEFLAQRDVVLAVGTRFTEEETSGWKLRLPETLVHLDVDAAEIGRNYPASVALVGDARQSLRAIGALLAGLEPRSRTAEVAALRKGIVADCRELAPEGVELVAALQEGLPRDAVLVSDLTVAAYWCRRLLELYEPRANIYPWGFCTLGFGLPAAIGAKLACPERPVVCLSGDAGFLFNCQELAVAAEAGLPVVVLLFNDNGYGALRPQQIHRFGRKHAVDVHNPDFVALARAFGVEARRVTEVGWLGPALAEALEAGVPAVIEVPVALPPQIMEPGPRALFEAAIRADFEAGKCTWEFLR